MTSTHLINEAYGKFGSAFEAAICRVLPLMATEYRGGQWDVYALDRGAIVVAPATATRLVSPVLNYKGAMTAQAAGVVATVRALQIMYASTQQPVFSRHLEQLRSYIAQHMEAVAIQKALS